MYFGIHEFSDEKDAIHYYNLLKLAEAIATVVHEKQVDKAGFCYINHPQTVSAFCKTTYAKIVAWLHDVVEDTEVTLEDLKRLGFDDFLIEAVRCVTKEEGYDEDEYYSRIKNNPIAKEVKLADLKHNTDASRWPDNLDSETYKKHRRKQLYYLSRIDYLNG